MHINQMTREIAVWLQQEKDVEYPNKVMVEAIEGLSNSGKATLALNLVKELKESVCIEADLFHYGRSKTKLVYQEWIKKAKGGQAIPENLPSLIWNYKKMQVELFDAIRRFNDFGEKFFHLILHDVLKEKMDGTEYDESYLITTQTIILVPGMYLRNTERFDRTILLDASLSSTVERKIDRSKQLGIQRDPIETREMVELVELPAMEKNIARYSPEGIRVSTSDFEKVYYIK